MRVRGWVVSVILLSAALLLIGALAEISKPIDTDPGVVAASAALENCENAPKDRSPEGLLSLAQFCFAESDAKQKAERSAQQIKDHIELCVMLALWATLLVALVFAIWSTATKVKRSGALSAQAAARAGGKAWGSVEVATRSLRRSFMEGRSAAVNTDDD